jgi:hypothetical protein
MAACLTTVAAGERALWIDAAGAAGPGWPGWPSGPLLLRPAGPTSALRSAEGVLRSGAFALVVLAGAEAAGTARLRLAHAAREGGSALVALTASASLAALHVTSRTLPGGYEWRRGPFGDPAAPIAAVVELHARAMGWSRRARLRLAVAPCDLRLPLGAGLADRRGV